MDFTRPAMAPPSIVLIPPTLTSNRSGSDHEGSTGSSQSFHSVSQEFGLTAAKRFTSPRPLSPTRLSSLSSISEWSKRTINLIHQDDFSWFRFDGSTSKQSHRQRQEFQDFEMICGTEKEVLIAPPPGLIRASTPARPPLDGYYQHPRSTFRSSSEITLRSFERDIANSRASAWKRWIQLATLANLCLTASMGELILAPAAPELARHFQVHSTLLQTLFVSVYYVGYAFSVLLTRPLSEWFGRVIVLHASNLCFVGFNIGCGFSRSPVTLLILRFHAAALGTACLQSGRRMLPDYFPPGRGFAAAATGLEAARLVGWLMGPLIGGVIVQFLSWRWSFWILAAMGGLNTVLAIFRLRDNSHSYSAISSLKAATRKRRAIERLSNLEKHPLMKRQRPSITMFLTHVYHDTLQPFQMLCLKPMVLISALSSASMWGVLTTVATALPFFYRPSYGLSDLETGCVYAAPGIGMLLGLLTYALLNDYLIKTRQKPTTFANVSISLASIILAAGGVALYGWTIQPHFSWIVPLVGLGMSGFGIVMLSTKIRSILEEACPLQKTNALVSKSIVTSLAAGLLPLSGHIVYERFGLWWGNTLFSGIVAMGIVSPIVWAIWAGRRR